MMSDKLTYQELKQRIKKLEKEIAECRQSEKSLKENERCHSLLSDDFRLESDQIFHSSSDGMALLDLDFNVIRMNNPLSEMFDLDMNETKGKKCCDVLPCQECHTPECPAQRILSGSDRFEHDFHTESPDKSKRSFIMIATPFFGTSRKLRGSLFNIREITKRVNAEKQAKIREQQLIQADKLASLGVLVSGVGHEINNPNNFITMNTSILRRAWKDITPILRQYYDENGDFMLANIPYSEMREYIPDLFDGICEGAERIKQIVSNLKDYVREDTSDMTQHVDVNKAVKAALTLLSNQIRNSTNFLSVNYAENLPWIMGNFQRIEQVMVNLIQNACHALSDQDQGIDMATLYDKNTDKVIVRVRDQGIGISQKHIRRILDPFFTTKRDTGGTGLGLSVCAGIVKEHGGELTFTSEPGKGTTVLLMLPTARCSQMP